MRETKSKFLGARVTGESHTAFFQKASRYGYPSDVLRELIEAFNEGRIEIKPPSVNRKWKENLYVHRIED